MLVGAIPSGCPEIIFLKIYITQRGTNFTFVIDRRYALILMTKKLNL